MRTSALVDVTSGNRSENGTPFSKCEDFAMANRARLRNPDKYREGERIRQARRRAKIRAFISDIKKSGCADCGVNHPAVLQFHHDDPNGKLGTVNRMIAEGKSEQSVRAEAAKCTVLCANCHAIRHWNERQRGSD